MHIQDLVRAKCPACGATISNHLRTAHAASELCPSCGTPTPAGPLTPVDEDQILAWLMEDEQDEDD